MKKLICILVSIFLLIPMCVGCAQDGYTDDSTKDVTDTPEVTTEDMTDTSGVATEDVTEPDVTEPDVTEPDVTEPDVSVQLPPCYNVEWPESFESLGKFMDRLHALEKENASEIGDVKFSDMIRTLHGLENLNTRYGEDAWVEWNYGFIYTLVFGRGGDAVAVAFMPFLSEADLKIFQDGCESGLCSYEQLLSNRLISNLQKQPLETELGTAYECTYDTKSRVGMKLQRFEYTDTSKNITYVLARCIDPDDGMIDSLLFVFDGENSFYVGTDDPNLTISVATKLSSVPVK